MSDFDNLIISAFRDKNFKYAAEEEFDPASTALDILSARLNAAIQTNPTLQNQILQVFGNARKFLISNIKLPAENFTVINTRGALSLRDTKDERVNNFYQMLLDRILDKIERKTSAPSGTSKNPLELSKPETTETSSTNETPKPASKSYMRIEVTTKLDKSDSTSGIAISDETIFGRKGTYKIQDSTVSRQHCKFFKDAYDSWYVQDLGSTNGTFLNGRKLQENGFGLLQKGNVVTIGKTTILIKNIFDYTPSK